MRNFSFFGISSCVSPSSLYFLFLKVKELKWLNDRDTNDIQGVTRPNALGCCSDTIDIQGVTWPNALGCCSDTIDIQGVTRPNALGCGMPLLHMRIATRSGSNPT